MLKKPQSLTFFICVLLMWSASAVHAQSTDAAAPKSDEHNRTDVRLHASTNVTGTTGRIVKWSDGNGSLADSVIAETTDGQIAIGSPAVVSSKFHVFTSVSLDGISVDGTQNPAFIMRNNGTVAGYLGLATTAGTYFSNSQPGDVALRSEAGNVLLGRTGLPATIVVNGNAVGIGTSSPGAVLNNSLQESMLHVFSTVDKQEFLIVQNASNSANAAAVVRTWADTASMNFCSHATARTVSRWGVTMGGWNEMLAWAGNGLAIGTLNATPLILGTGGAARMTFDNSGNITMGSTAAPVATTIHGTLKADQIVGAVYQDVAEWVPATTKMAPGTVVVLNREIENTVMPSANAYDTAVAGVVSEKPAVILGAAGDSKAQIATTGRVKVHVDATAGAIAIGDLLVTSNKPGTAMKSQPVDIGGVQFHRPGTVIGKALESLRSGEGDILVLLSLQ